MTSPRITLGCDQIVATQEILNGGVVRFDCATGVKLGAPITVNTDTVIDGNGVTFDGQGLTQIMRVTNNARLTLLDVTVTRGATTSDNGAGINLASGRLVAFDSHFTDNDVNGTSSGGAIAAVPTTALVEIYGGSFRDNTAETGGAIAAYAGLTVMNATFMGNVATGTGSPAGDGGALHVVGPGDTTLCGVTLDSNVAGSSGGALVVISTDSTSIVQLTDVVMSGNTAQSAGASYIQGSPQLTMRRVSVIENSCMGTAGGLWLQGSTFDAETVSIVGNRTDGATGAGVFISGSTGRFAFSTIADNLGNCPGCAAAGIANGAAVELSATLVVDNESQTTPAVCSQTGTNGGATWQWPNDLPLCATGATVSDPLLAPRGVASGPAGTFVVRKPSASSPVIGAVATGCPTEDILGRPRPTPCASGAVEP